nr:toxic anion resistance protein [uncultured Merdimonas sp.]
MAEITLDTLRKQKVHTLDNRDGSADSPEVLESRITKLTPEEMQKVEEIKEQIDLTDSQMLMQYGAGVKQNIADFSENILNNVKTKDTGYIGELMTGLVTSVQGLDFESLEKETGIMKFLKKAESKVKKFMMQYEKLEVQVDRIEGKLDEARMEMLKDIGMLDAMYEKNLDYFHQLQLYIVAGEEKLKELREQTIPALRKEAEDSGDPMNAQVVKDFEDTVGQFEKKLHDLRTSRTIAIQTAPQLRMVQNNDKLLADKIQTAIQETIPLWKSQMVMALGLYRQQEALKLQRDITDTTNQLLIQNSEKLKQNTLDVAKESERSIVDIATLKKANENLISTMTEAVKIQQEGRRKRQEAEQELEKLEQDIRRTLLTGA